jgi:hypothetical protein
MVNETGQAGGHRSVLTEAEVREKLDRLRTRGSELISSLGREIGPFSAMAMAEYIINGMIEEFDLYWIPPLE